MRPPSAEPGTPAEWLDRARSSLAVAQQDRAEGALWEEYCFQAQQAAEKAIKAVYQLLDIRFRYTHDIDELWLGLEGSGIPMPEAVRNAAGLTRYAFKTRYPGLYEPVTEEDYEQAVAQAAAVVAWAEDVLSAAHSGATPSSSGS